MGHPEHHFHAIHIGGTNGKGSVAVLIAAALCQAGTRTGLYTSPHLVDVRERMVVDGRPLTRAAFAQWTEFLREAIEEVDASFFEATTAIAFADFAARGADVAVVEVGLGGRLDSTNVLEPVVSAVTHVTRDHTEYLGASLQSIAMEKAGIAKPGAPFVIGETDSQLTATLREAGRAAGARVIAVPPDARYEGPLGLLGPHQRRNAAVAQAVLAALPDDLQPPGEAVARGFASARLPGRLDRRGKWIFDVAHNPGGMVALVEALSVLTPPRPVHALVSVLGDKDWVRMIELLREAVDAVWLTSPPSAPAERRWDLDAAGCRFSSAVVEADFARALQGVQQGAATVVVAGSFHTVGDAMARLPGFAPLR